jgi:hypothetical protein
MGIESCSPSPARYRCRSPVREHSSWARKRIRICVRSRGSRSNVCSVHGVRLVRTDVCRYDLRMVPAIRLAGALGEDRWGDMTAATAWRLEGVGNPRKDFLCEPTRPRLPRRSGDPRCARPLAELLPRLPGRCRTGSGWVLGSSRPPRFRRDRPLCAYRARSCLGSCGCSSVASSEGFFAPEGHFVLRTSPVHTRRSAHQDAYAPAEAKDRPVEAGGIGKVDLRSAVGRSSGRVIRDFSPPGL